MVNCFMTSPPGTSPHAWGTGDAGAAAAAVDDFAPRVESDFLLPDAFTRDVTELEFAIRGLNEDWSELGYELWGLK